MTWAVLGVAAITALGIIAVLGIPIAWALRARGLALAIVAVPAALAVVAIASIIAPIAGLSWSLLAPVVVTAALTLVLFMVRRMILPHVPSRTAGLTRSGANSFWTGIGAAAIGGAVIAISLASGLRSGDAISQTFDAGFHLNAVRYILDTGVASPFAMDLTSPGSPVFYPTLWHAFVTLVVQLTGASIPVATNASLMVVTAVVWPVGAVALGRAVAGPSLSVTLISGAAAAAFPNFPLFLSGYGVLYPNLLSLALMPYLLVATLLLLNLGAARRALPLAPAGRWLLMLGALGAAVLAHPNVMHALLVWAVAPAVWAAVRALRGAPVPAVNGLPAIPRTPLWLRRTLAITGLIALICVIAAAWITGQTFDNAWGGIYGPRSAVLQIIGGTPNVKGHAWIVSLIVLVGVIAVWRRRRMRWLLGSAACLALFYFIADGFPTSDWRTLIVGPWYNDPRRLAALVPFGALPLLVVGAVSLWAVVRPGLQRLARQRTETPEARRRVLTRYATVALLALIAAGQAGSYTTMQTLRKYYDLEEAVVLSEDEQSLIKRLESTVPTGELIANNPLNGSALAYALSDREVLFPHGSGSYPDLSYDLVDGLVADPAKSCSAAAELDVHYVLDFGMDYIFEEDPIREPPFKRMTDLEKSPILTEIDREGDAVLYQLNDCK